jgi:PAS domain S-box-containing protein
MKTYNHEEASMSESTDSLNNSGSMPELHIQDIFNSAPIGIFTTTPEGRIISANAALVRMFGYESPEELIASITDIATQVYADPADREEFMRLLKEHGEVSNHACRFRHRDGTELWGSMNARALQEADGRIVVYQKFITDITEQNKASEKLKRLEWMLSGKSISNIEVRTETHDQGYGDLTELNRDGLILKSIGREHLESFANDYLELLGTSSAVYEANGDYAFGIFSSGWCRMMDRASRRLCDTSDNAEALDSGRWLCHESCWTDCSKRAIAECAPIDIACNGGIRLYAVPIFAGEAGENVVGAINFGYGDPPKDPEQLRKLAKTYHLDFDDLVRKAKAYDSRPPFIVELAKKRLHATARLIGSMIETKQAEEALRKSEETLRATLNSIGDAVISTDTEGRVASMNPVAESLAGWSEKEATGQPLETVFRIVNEQTGQSVKSPVTNVLKSGHIVGLANHTLLIARDGREIPIADSGAPIRNDAGEITGVVLVFCDQTKERRARQALAESERRFQKMLGGVPDMISIHSSEMDILYSNWQGFGAVPETMRRTGTKCYKTYRGHTDICPDCLARKVLETGKPLREEVQLPEGTWVDLRVIPLLDKNNHVEMFMEWVQDTTERKQAEEALRQRIEYEQLLNEASTMALVADDLAKFYDRCLALVGERLSIDRAYFFRHDEATDTMDNTHEWCAKGIAPQQDKLQGIPGSAVSWWLQTMRRNEIICYPNIEDIPDEAAKEILRSQDIKSILVVPLFIKGQYYGFLGLDDCAQRRDWRQEDVDILLSLSSIVAMATERKQSEELLQDERQQLLSIFNGIEEAIYIADPVTYELLFVNDFLKKMLGRNLLGKKCYEQFQGFKAPCEFCTNQIILQNPGEVYRWEYYNPNLNRHYLLFDRIIKWTDGRDVRFEMAIDITDRKRAEAEREKMQAQLIQAQKMESVGRLAGGVAHDFNNMLTVISGNAQMALYNTAPDDPVYKDLKIILDAARRSADITRQLLAFARRQTIDPKVIDLNATVEGMLKILRRLIGEDVDLSWQPGPGRMPVFMDPSQLDQVLANLCVNARDAIEGVGKVTIETGNVVLDEAYCADHAGFVPGEFIMLAVSDDGYGMGREALDNIFEPFFTTKGVGEGTGLGLSTVYGIVKQNHGFINVYSEPGKGTTCKIYLPPCAGEDAGIKAQETTEIPAGRGETVLIVEDEASILKLAQRILERLGYHVLAASTPGKAVALAEEHAGHVHLLITDVIMPEMNGRDLAESLKAHYPTLKVLFMSGYTANVIAHRGVLDEGVYFIQKPFSNRDLAVKVREVLNRD